MHQTQRQDQGRFWLQQPWFKRLALASVSAVFTIHSGPAAAAGAPAVFGIPVDFILFALTLLGVALFHKYTLRVALTGFN